MASLSEMMQPAPGSREWYADRVYGTGTPVDAGKKSKEAGEFIASMSPGLGDLLSARDSWTASGRGAEALSQGNYGQAAGEYGNMLLGLLGAVPGAGIIARGTKRGAEWMDKTMPTLSRMLDSATPSDPKNTTNIFAGPTAKTADQAALSQAQELAQSGASRDYIWKQTGWFQGRDGKWRFEIDDSDAMMGMVPKVEGPLPADLPWLRSGPMSDLVDHPALYDAYPALAKGDVQIHPNVENSYYSRMGTEPSAWDHYSFRPKAINNPSVPLHELQHGVQQAEDFARGGSWRSLINTPVVEELAQSEFRAAKAAGANLADEDILANARSNIARRLYNDLAGEVEARNVQTRLPMTSAERRAKAPWETQDVPDDQQIVRFR